MKYLKKRMDVEKYKFVINSLVYRIYLTNVM